MKKYISLLMIGLMSFMMTASVSCDRTETPVAPDTKLKQELPDCADFPSVLPAGITIEDVGKFLADRTDVSFKMLVPEVLEILSSSYSPEEYYINSSGLHWGQPKITENQSRSSTAANNCYSPYGFSLVGGFHFAYWFSYRPPSYNAYMAWIPIYAQPYGSNGILVQKRDICWICNCNPWCAQIWTSICAK